MAHDISFAAVPELRDLYENVLVSPKLWNNLHGRTFDMTKETDALSLRDLFRLNLLRSPTLVIKPGRPPYLLAESAMT